MRIGANGNVGIGTTSPGQKFTVLGVNGAPATSGNSTDGVARFGSSVTNLVLDVGLIGGGTPYTWLQSRQQTSYDSNYNLALNPNGGNVGIGTTNLGTATKLVVASPQTTANNTVIGEFTKDSGSNSYGSSILRLSRSVGGESTDLELNSGGAGPYRYGTAADTILVNNQNYTNGPYGSIHFVTNSIPRLTIGGGTLGGYVGIGTTSPLDRLHVNTIRPIIMGYNGTNGVYGSHIGFNMTINTQVVPNTVTKLGGTVQSGGAIITVDYNGNYRLQTYDGGNESASTINYVPQFTFSNTGYLGVGTTSPSANLHVAGTGNTGLRVEGGATSVPQYQLAQGANIRGYLFYDNTNSVMTLNRSGSAGAGVNITGADNVGIGTTNPTQKLSVAGTIRAYAVVVDTGWSDYVFDKDYRLAPLSEVEQQIKAEKHLPGIPSAAEVAEHGVSLGDMQSKLLAKVEELTLYMIELKKENADLRQKVDRLEAKSPR